MILNKPVIALTGPMGAGKSTVAQHLVQRYGWTRVALAAPLKAMCEAVGMSWDQHSGRLKNEPNHLFCGRTNRYVLQTLGTEWGRNMVGQEVWTNLWFHAAQQAIRTNPTTSGIVCDDLRFLTEEAFMDTIHAVVIRIDGRSMDNTGMPGHQSEAEWMKIKAHVTLQNKGTIGDLHNSIDRLLGGVFI